MWIVLDTEIDKDRLVHICSHLHQYLLIVKYSISICKEWSSRLCSIHGQSILMYDSMDGFQNLHSLNIYQINSPKIAAKNTGRKIF